MLFLHIHTCVFVSEISLFLTPLQYFVAVNNIVYGSAFLVTIRDLPNYVHHKIYLLYIYTTSKYKKMLISKRRIGILKKLPKQGEDSESL